MNKKCAKCGETKYIDEFSRDGSRKDGHDPYCKKCKKEYHDNRRKECHEYMLKAEAERRKNRREKILIENRMYSKTSKGKETRNRYYENNPQKRAARNAVSVAVRSGKLPKVKTLICSICNIRQAEHYHHHRGYDKDYWVDVVPVCIICHKDVG